MSSKKKQNGGRSKTSLPRGSKNAPVAYNTPIRTRAPKTSAVRNGVVVVSHTEFAGDFRGSSEFEYDTFQLNPGLADHFQWLSAVANRYEKYRFRKLSFRYVPSCATSTTGRVIMFVDHDAADVGPDTKSEAYNFQATASGNAWSPLTLNALLPSDKDLRYTRGQALTSNLDIKTYDIGVAYFAADGGSEDLWGEVFVDYEVELHIPQMAPLQQVGELAAPEAADTTAPIGKTAAIAAPLIGGVDLQLNPSGALSTKNGFEGMVTVVNSMASGGQQGTFAVAPSSTARYSHIIAASTKSTASAAQDALLAFKVILDAGQWLMLTNSALTGAIQTTIRALSGDVAWF